MHFRFIFAFMERLKHILIILFTLSATSLSAREVINFNKAWKFCLNIEADKNPAAPDFNDKGWRTLDLPHDWAIEGDFNEHNPSGTGGGALPGGIGWYRKSFKISGQQNDYVFSIEFDGVYMNSSVYINGHLLGTRPYGYISFSYDLTPYLNWDGDNVIAVKVDNSDQPNSRWYSGCGIYRDVRIVKTRSVHVDQWGTYITTEINDQYTVANIDVTIENDRPDPVEITVYSAILDANRKGVSMMVDNMVAQKGTNSIQQKVYMTEHHLWILDDP